MEKKGLVERLGELPHLHVAVLLFLFLFAAWLRTGDANVWGLVNTVFGVIVGFLTGRAAGGKTQ